MNVRKRVEVLQAKHCSDGEKLKGKQTKYRSCKLKAAVQVLRGNLQTNEQTDRKPPRIEYVKELPLVGEDVGEKTGNGDTE